MSLRGSFTSLDTDEESLGLRISQETTKTEKAKRKKTKKKKSPKTVAQLQKL
jgi:hypothetical protein